MSVVEIRNFLQQHNHDLTLEQFALDWIGEMLDEAEEILEADEIVIDDETFRSALHYSTGSILEVLRPDVACWEFFRELEMLTRGR